MDAFVIHGGQPLSGSIRINGAKNAALPQMTAALLTNDPVVLHDAPNLVDVRSMATLLTELGCHCQRDELSSDAASGSGPGRGNQAPLRLHTTVESNSHARYDLVCTMRASVSVLGPMLAKRGSVRIAMPGGCAIGDRPIDLHLRGMEALGASVEMDSGDIVLKAPCESGGAPRLIGGRVFLGGRFGSTVLGTANVMSAATLARGMTVIEFAACEPEIADLAHLLNEMGAKIVGAGTPRIIIDGVDSLHGAEHTVIADRIEAGTFMIASAITGGDVTIENCPLDGMMAVTEALKQSGVSIAVIDDVDPMRAVCRVTRAGAIGPAQITTQPHPGYPTDLQAQMMALLSLASGNSVITERIFPQRFLHVAELIRMGAALEREGSTVVVSGVGRLVGAPVMASDLRASASLVLAGLAAKGQTIVRRVYHLDRGYEQMEVSLQQLSAQIQRIVDGSDGLHPAPTHVGDYAPVSGSSN